VRLKDQYKSECGQWIDHFIYGGHLKHFSFFFWWVSVFRIVVFHFSFDITYMIGISCSNIETTWFHNVIIGRIYTHSDFHIPMYTPTISTFIFVTLFFDHWFNSSYWSKSFSIYSHSIGEFTLHTPVLCGITISHRSLERCGESDILWVWGIERCGESDVVSGWWWEVRKCDF